MIYGFLSLMVGLSGYFFYAGSQETIELDQMNYYLTAASFAFLAGILLIYLFCCRGPIDKVI
jgi:hypothetical protein